MMNQFIKPNVNSTLQAAMPTRKNAPKHLRLAKHRLSAVIFSFLPFTFTGAFLLPSMAIASDDVSYSQQFQAEQSVFSQAELAQILAPIALYPDTL